MSIIILTISFLLFAATAHAGGCKTIRHSNYVVAVAPYISTTMATAKEDRVVRTVTGDVIPDLTGVWYLLAPDPKIGGYVRLVDDEVVSEVAESKKARKKAPGINLPNEEHIIVPDISDKVAMERMRWWFPRPVGEGEPDGFDLCYQRPKNSNQIGSDEALLCDERGPMVMLSQPPMMLEPNRPTPVYAAPVDLETGKYTSPAARMTVRTPGVKEIIGKVWNFGLLSKKKAKLSRKPLPIWNEGDGDNNFIFYACLNLFSGEYYLHYLYSTARPNTFDMRHCIKLSKLVFHHTRISMRISHYESHRAYLFRKTFDKHRETFEHWFMILGWAKRPDEAWEVFQNLERTTRAALTRLANREATLDRDIQAVNADVLDRFSHIKTAPVEPKSRIITHHPNQDDEFDEDHEQGTFDLKAEEKAENEPAKHEDVFADGDQLRSLFYEGKLEDPDMTKKEENFEEEVSDNGIVKSTLEEDIEQPNFKKEENLGEKLEELEPKPQKAKDVPVYLFRTPQRSTNDEAYFRQDQADQEEQTSSLKKKVRFEQKDQQPINLALGKTLFSISVRNKNKG